MSWQTDKGQGGGTGWRGVDEIRDMWHMTAEERWAFGRVGAWIACGVFLIGGLAALAPLGDMFTGRGVGWWVRSMGLGAFVAVTVLGFVCLAVAVGAGFFALTTKKPEGFIVRPWTLTASASGFAYEAGTFSPSLDPAGVSRDGRRWSVPLDAVARVEAGRSVDWQAVRVYDRKPMSSREGVAKIPEVEFQTFLYLNDGSRRVIYTVNGKREEAVSLATAVRSWIESQRGGASIAAPIAPPSLGGADNSEGFNL